MSPTRSGRLLIVACIALAACVDYPPPLTDLPHGTFEIDPLTIPPKLDTDAMTVTVNDEFVTFNYTTSSGDAVVVTYQISE